MLEREHLLFYVIFKIKMLKKENFSHKLLEFLYICKKINKLSWERFKKKFICVIINLYTEYSRFSRDANVKNIQKGDGYFLEEDSGGFTN